MGGVVGVKRIPIHGRGYIKGHALVDAQDYDHLSQFRWYQKPKSGYVYRQEGFRITKQFIYMHREVLGLQPGDGCSADHINRNVLDNRRSNLRAATKSQNAQNARLRSDNSSGFRGVGFDKQTGKWRAAVRINRRTFNLGRYDTAREAGRVTAEFRAQYASFSPEYDRAGNARI